jgi:hypothetical protein
MGVGCGESSSGESAGRGRVVAAALAASVAGRPSTKGTPDTPAREKQRRLAAGQPRRALCVMCGLALGIAARWPSNQPASLSTNRPARLE